MEKSSNRPKKNKVKSSGEEYLFPMLFNISQSALLRAQKNPDTYEFVVVNVFAAFAMEAYLNHVAEKKISVWKNIAPKLRRDEKLSQIWKSLGFCPDLSKRPFSTLAQLFSFRDKIAHGVTDSFETEKTHYLYEQEKPQLRKAGWESACNYKTALRFLADVRAIVDELRARAGLNDPFIATSAKQKWRPIKPA